MEQLKESIKDLKNQLSTFIKDYYDELLKIWKEITTLRTNQKFFIAISSIVTSIVTSLFTAFIIFNYIKK